MGLHSQNQFLSDTIPPLHPVHSAGAHRMPQSGSPALPSRDLENTEWGLCSLGSGGCIEVGTGNHWPPLWDGDPFAASDPCCSAGKR